jgi:xylulokinase
MYLGLDLGTSGLRALLVDAGGKPLGSTQCAYSTSHPHLGWSEQNPALWVAACTRALEELKERFPQQLKALKGIGISGHMHGAVLLDKAQAVLRPCILWNDTRSSEQAALLDQTKGVRELSGNIVFPGFTAPKLMWVKENEPEIFARTETVLLPKDYLRFWLSGELKSEMSDAAGTSWLDVGTRSWSNKILAHSGVNQGQLPALVEGSEVAGTLKAEHLSAWGIEQPVVIVGGGADNAATACGAGVMNEGQGFVSLGTSGVILAARSSFSPQPETAVHTFCHAVPNRWYQMGVTMAATDSLNWFADICGQTPEALTNELDIQLKAPSNIHFLPYLSGERTPHNDSVIRGAFVGLDIAHARADMTQSIMQGVAFSLRQSFDALCATGTDLKKLLVVGGGANSRLWVEMLATVLNVPLELPEEGDFGAALGAARLAMCGAIGCDPLDVMTAPKIATTIHPNKKHRAAYATAYEKFKTIYPAARAIQ